MEKKNLTVKDSTPGKMYGNVKTHKIGNPARVITSGCNKAKENLSILVENVLYDIASELPARIKDTNHMLLIIDNLNSLDLPLNSILVSFNIINAFPNIDNNLGLSSVKKYLDLCSKNIPQYHLSPTALKRFRGDIFVLWPHGRESLVLFVYYINTRDPTQKINFTMEVAEPGIYLEFLDLKLKWENGKITVDVHSKPMYVLPITCYFRKSINNISHDIALRLRRICDSDKEFKNLSEE